MKNIDDLDDDSEIKDLSGNTNWDFLKYLWNKNNSDNKVPEDLEMPDYYSMMSSIHG